MTRTPDQAAQRSAKQLPAEQRPAELPRPEQASPEHASPEPAGPEQASTRQASPEQASTGQASPEQASTGQRPPEQLRADARQNHARLINAATLVFAERGADAPLENIARRAGVGIGTLYRHFPTRLDLQAAVFRSQVGTVCGDGDALLRTAPPEQAFIGWMRSLNAYLVTKRGLSHALIEAVGIESELISSCWVAMRETTERLLTNGQRCGAIRTDVTATDVMRLVHGVAVSTERAPERADALLSIMIDGLRTRRD
jgi:AcrR family transcriptional regulator